MGGPGKTLTECEPGENDPMVGPRGKGPLIIADVHCILKECVTWQMLLDKYLVRGTDGRLAHHPTNCSYIC